MELLRFSELFLYFLYYVLFTKTEAEYEKIRKMIYFDFQFGIRYPRFLLIFCMVVTYSLTCPVIAPCGMCINLNEFRFPFIVIQYQFTGVDY